jgi:hypothetical protein
MDGSDNRGTDEPDQQSFLWVNKTLGSKSLSNSRTTPSFPQINSHAQKTAKRHSKQLKLVRRSTTHLVGWRKTSSPKTDEETARKISPGKKVKHIVPNKDGRAYEDLPSPALDSCCNPAVRIDALKQHVLQYFMKVWMPSPDYIPPGCQVTGFTPIWPNDGNISSEIIRGALQSTDEVSIYALLTACTRRMQIVNKLPLERQDLPDLYTIKAIQALRKHIMAGTPPSERLILDLSYLVLAELYAKSPSRSDTYWKMTRTLIANHGGLHKLVPFTAQAALAYDYFIAAGTVTAPALDPFRYPTLLGLQFSSENPRQGIRDRVALGLEQLDPRIRILAQESNALFYTVRAIRALPDPAVEGIMACLRGHIPHLYPVISAPFHPSGDGISGHSNIQHAMAADGLAVHARFQAYQVWLWYSSLGFLDSSIQLGKSISTPRGLIRQVSEIWRYIGSIQSMLEKTGWAMRAEVVLWIGAVGIFVATSELDRSAYRGIFTSMASSLNITGEEHLGSIFALHLPLDHIQLRPFSKLWKIIEEDRDRYPSRGQLSGDLKVGR